MGYLSKFYSIYLIIFTIFISFVVLRVRSRHSMPRHRKRFNGRQSEKRGQFPII